MINDQQNKTRVFFDAQASVSRPWMQRALPILIFLGCCNIAMNLWQSWSGFHDLNLYAAQRLGVQTELISARVQDRMNALDQVFELVSDKIDALSLSDASIAYVANADRALLAGVDVAVFGPQGQLEAQSSPIVLGDLDGLDNLLSRARANPKVEVRSIVTYRNAPTMLIARVYRSKAHLATIVLIVPVAQHLLDGKFSLAAGTSAALIDSKGTVIKSVPPQVDTTIGQTWNSSGRRPGPTMDTWYQTSSGNDDEELTTARSISVWNDANWKVQVGYSVRQYRAQWWTSMYASLSGIAIQIGLVLVVVVLVRVDGKLRANLKSAMTLTSTVFEHMHAPVALVDRVTGSIVHSNNALVALFGALAGEGEPFSRLFVEPGNWDAVRASTHEGAVAMLTRNGTAYMMLQCACLDALLVPNLSGCALVTLSDVSQQYQHLKRLQVEADFDALTGLANRRHFAKAAAAAVAEAQERRAPLAVLALDLDFFKRVNDTHGHAAGDSVLTVFAQLLKGLLRGADLPARLGGEEFAALLVDTSLDKARVVAERIRMAIVNTPIVLPDGQVITQTISIGIALYRDGEADLNAAQERADAALYCAKKAGRNRVEENETAGTGAVSEGAVLSQ